MASKTVKRPSFTRRRLVLAALGVLVLVIAGVSWKKMRSNTENTSKLFTV